MGGDWCVWVFVLTFLGGCVVDTCMGCKEQDIDISPSLFSKVAPSGDGRVHGIEWGGKVTGGKKRAFVG